MFAHRYFERAEARSLALVICCRVSPVEVSKSFLFRGKSVGVPDGHPFFLKRNYLSKKNYLKGFCWIGPYESRTEHLEALFKFRRQPPLYDPLKKFLNGV